MPRPIPRYFAANGLLYSTDPYARVFERRRDTLEEAGLHKHMIIHKDDQLGPDQANSRYNLNAFVGNTSMYERCLHVRDIGRTTVVEEWG